MMQLGLDFGSWFFSYSGFPLHFSLFLLIRCIWIGFAIDAICIAKGSGSEFGALD